MMTIPYRWSLCWIAGAFMLTACDRAKEQLVAVLKEHANTSGAAVETTAATDAETAPPAVAEYAGETVRHLGADDVTAFIEVPDRVVIIDYYADWCGPCRQLSPVLEQVTRSHEGKVLLGKVNVDEHPELAQNAGVRGIPDVRIYLNGKQVDRFVGAIPENAVQQKIAPHLAKLKPDAAAGVPAATAQPEVGTPQPLVQPMTKDWLPPGIERR